MGLFSGSTKTKTTETSNTGPSEFQRPYLDQTFGAAKDIYNGAKDTPYYQGEMYAGMTAEAKDVLSRLKSYASTTGLGNATALSSIGSGLIGNYDKASSTLDQFTKLAGTDATSSNIEAAQRYADNPFVQSQIDANSRDVTRNLTEDTLPGIDRAASGMGNLNSSRAGVAAGIARRGAEDRIGDISATIRGNAYNQGLTMAQADRATNLSALGQASSAYGNLGAAGINAMGAGNDAAMDSYDAINRANGIEQADRQGSYDAAFKKWQGEDTRDMDLLARYASVVGSNQWGQSGTSSGTSTQKSSGSILSQIMGAAATAGSIYTGMPKSGGAGGR